MMPDFGLPSPYPYTLSPELGLRDELDRYVYFISPTVDLIGTGADANFGGSSLLQVAAGRTE